MKRKRHVKSLQLFLMLAFTMNILILDVIWADSKNEKIQSLAGQWRFQLDPDEVGESEKWFKWTLTDKIILPASTDKAQKGFRTVGAESGFLSREYEHVGSAWYQKTLDIPENWGNKHLSLFLERCLWQTTVWIDDRTMGSQNSLTTPHVYQLGNIKPGKHSLTIKVDNSAIVNISDNGHSYTNYTQSKWNGIVGRIELTASDPIRIKKLNVYPNLDDRSVELNVMSSQTPDGFQSGTISFIIESDDHEKLAEKTINITDDFNIQTTISMGSTVKPWDPFNPTLYRVKAILNAQTQQTSCHDVKTTSFGFRKISFDGTRLLINGRPTRLRGTLECCIFPMTGYPPTEVDEWLRIFQTAKEYGLNHIRFHSWCPPEAAFSAADQVGILLQAETPLWIDYWMNKSNNKNNNVWIKPVPFGEDPNVVEFIQSEFNRILDTYGNHPSFCFMCIGNELAGDYDLLETIICNGQQKDPRRLYSCSTARKHTTVDEYYVSHRTEQGMIRGIRTTEMNWNYSDAMTQMAVPTISHEIGQWVVYPDYNEISKYTGVLKPRNLKKFQSVLIEQGMEDQAMDFHRATGEFSRLLYKAEIEANLRTPELSGYQLLDLHDFPGQGEALVGMLDAFWDSKGIVTPAEHRQYCNDTVPLSSIQKYVWTNDETLEAKIQISHYGKNDLNNADIEWKIFSRDGKAWKSGQFKKTLPTGHLIDVGNVKYGLSDIKVPKQLRMSIVIKNTPFKNEWNLWVLPANPDDTIPADILVTHAFDEQTRTLLSRGKKVLLLPPFQKENELVVRSRFLPVFWSFTWAPGQSGILGIFCNPDHPLFAEFPTEFHSDWQWYDLTESSQAFVLNSTHKSFRPLIQAIDDFHRNDKLGYVIETRVGTGKLLVCGFDLESDLQSRPVARQFRTSLFKYMSSEKFDPTAELDVAFLQNLLSLD